MPTNPSNDPHHPNSKAIDGPTDDGFVTIQLGPAKLTLLPQRAIWWDAKKTLFIADPHFGKAATFRHAGIYVPVGTTQQTLNRLQNLVQKYQPRTLAILGDFFHARPAQNSGLATAFSDWRTAHPDLSIILIRGNHDRHAGDPPPAWQITCVDEPHPFAGLQLRHFPNATDQPSLAGHTHPAVTLHGFGRDRVRKACFHLHQSCLTLPAFGSFTGSAAIQPAENDRIWLVDDDAILAI